MAAPPTAPSALAVALRKASLPLIPKVKYDELPTVTLQNVVATGPQAAQRDKRKVTIHKCDNGDPETLLSGNPFTCDT